MLFKPKKFKYKKFQKGSKLNRITKNFINKNCIYGKLNLVAVSSGTLNSTQILTLKQTISKIIKKKGKLRVNVFPNIGISKKPSEVRMGKGKGNLDHWLFKIKKGVSICEIETKLITIGIKALKSVRYKIPIETKVIKY